MPYEPGGDDNIVDINDYKWKRRVAVYFSCLWRLELLIRQGQDARINSALGSVTLPCPLSGSSRFLLC